MKQHVEPLIFHALEGPAILIGKYIADGPGYVGPLICSLNSALSTIVYPKLQDKDGNFRMNTLFLDEDHPTVAAVLPFTKEYAAKVVENLRENSREFCGEPDHVDPGRTVIVRWSNGAEGAIMFWGESCWYSSIQFEGSGKGERFFDHEMAAEGKFVTPSGALSALMKVDGQDLTPLTSGEIQPLMIFNPNHAGESQWEMVKLTKS